MSEIAERFGENLAAHLERSGMTQEKFADLAEMHRTQIGLILRGQRAPRLDTLLKLAGALQISPCDLLDGLSWEPPAHSPQPPAGRFKVTPKRKR